MSDQSVRVSPFSSWQKEVILHGIQVTPEGDPVIPCLGPLIELSETNKWCSEFQWDGHDRTWTAIHSGINGG